MIVPFTTLPLQLPGAWVRCSAFFSCLHPPHNPETDGIGFASANSIAIRRRGRPLATCTSPRARACPYTRRCRRRPFRSCAPCRRPARSRRRYSAAADRTPRFWRGEGVPSALILRQASAALARTCLRGLNRRLPPWSWIPPDLCSWPCQASDRHPRQPST